MININKVGSPSYDQNDAAIDGSRVVWVQKTATGKTAIYYKNMESGATSLVRQSNLNQINPDISGTKVVWEQQITSTIHAIYYKDLANGKYGRLFTSTEYQSLPKISGNMVVWKQNHNYKEVIFYKNILTGSHGIVPNKEGWGNQINPSISGNNIVWQFGDYATMWDAESWEIYSYNLATHVYNSLTTPGVYNKFNPDISGNNVVYTCNKKIWIKNIENGSNHIVMSSTKDQGTPKISANRVVWTQVLSNGHTAIFIKNLTTGNNGRVSVSTSNQMRPNISGTKIVWTQKMANGHLAIYYKNIVTGYCTKVTP